MRVSEIRVNQIRVNQGLGVHSLEKHKLQIKYQYILLVDITFYYILFSNSSDSRNNTFKH